MFVGAPATVTPARLKAVDFISSHREEPFFLYLATNAPHGPYRVGEEWSAPYRDKVTWRSAPEFYGMVTNLDHNVGKVLQAVERSGRAEDTIVVFTSDNGGLSTAEGSPTCNFPLNEGKGWTHEGGVREPWIVRYPRLVPPGTTCSQTITSPDLFPTCLELAGLPAMPEQHADGLSFASLLRDPATARLDRDAIYWHYPHYGNQGGTPGAAIRQGDWKLIESFETGRVQLFNLGDDLSETRDRAADETDRSRRLTDLLHAWRREIGGRMPEPTPDYQPPDDPLAHPAV